MARENDEFRIRIIAGSIIQVLAVIALVAIILIDSVYDDTDYSQIELLLGGVIAAPPARELIKYFGNKRDK